LNKAVLKKRTRKGVAIALKERLCLQIEEGKKRGGWGETQLTRGEEWGDRGLLR